jgi:hypothetical protein
MNLDRFLDFNFIADKIKSLLNSFKRRITTHRSSPITQKALITLLSSLITLSAVFAQQPQEDDSAVGEILENFFRDNEQATQTDVQLFLERLEALRSRPLDLNTLDRNDLTDLHLFSDVQVDNLLRYRTDLGDFLDILELQAVPGWELDDISRLMPFARINKSGLQQRSRPLRDGLTHGDDELLLRWGRPSMPNYRPDSAEGKANIWAMRYRHSFDQRLRFGFTAENDPGEAFFRGSNRHGFDFYSAHVSLQNVNRTVRTVVLGDFAANLGQGLLLYTSFAQGKSAEAINIFRNARKISPYGAFGEAFFLRGAAATFQLNRHWSLTTLHSNRRRDANLQIPETPDFDPEAVIFTALQSAGLHRTESEIADEKAVREALTAVSLTRTLRQGHVTVNGLHVRYDKVWQPSEAAFRRFVFSGRELVAGSADYTWRGRSWLLSGEVARSANGGMAFVNGLQWSVARKVTAALVHRHLGRAYEFTYTAPFAEANGAANEQGLYTALQIRPSKPWQIDLYADLWRHPWLRFGVDAPSTGREYLARALWKPLKTFSVYALFQSETKQENSDFKSGTLANRQRERFRIHAVYKISSALEGRSRVEWTQGQTDAPGAARGFLAFQEMVWRPLMGAWSGSMRYTIFDTQDNNTRIFAFENDIFAAVSIPAFAGRGSRYFINLRWRVNDWLRLESRFEQTLLQKAVTTTGIPGRETVWKLQARLRFKE